MRFINACIVSNKMGYIPYEHFTFFTNLFISGHNASAYCWFQSELLNT